MLSPSKKLQEILTADTQQGAGIAYVERINSDPLIAVGFAPERKLGLVLLLPPGVLHGDVTLDRIECKRSMKLNINLGDGEPETIEAGTLFFDAVSPAVEIVLDALANMVVNDIGRAGDLAQDFIDLFKPGKRLGDDELIGLFGELVLISIAPDKEKALDLWHEASEGRYDFTSGNSRLEVKTTLGELRKHHFSSSQLPAKSGVKLRVASVLTETVQDGTSVIDLWQTILPFVKKPKLVEKLNGLVLKTILKDYDKSISLGFDYDAAIRSILYFAGESVPTPILTEGVLSASWEALMPEEDQALAPDGEDVNEDIRAICSPGVPD